MRRTTKRKVTRVTTVWSEYEEYYEWDDYLYVYKVRYYTKIKPRKKTKVYIARRIA